MDLSVHPWDKKEYKEAERWSKSSEARILLPKNCISGWFDICGYGEVLDECNWNLSKVQNKGFIELLNRIHQLIAHPLITIPPVLTEKILILNDGLARTCDLIPSIRLSYIAIPFTYYIRDLFFAYKFSLKLCQNFGLGLRAVLSGGERIQYSNETFTGNSILSHDDKNISEFGTELLQTNFLYNPAEFQMNTAFAKAFSIESLGSKYGIEPNNLFIERSFWEKCALVPFITYGFSNNEIHINYSKKVIMKIFIRKSIQLDIHNLKIIVDNIEAIELDMPYENEVVFCRLD
jgi:hypothetical protein